MAQKKQEKQLEAARLPRSLRSATFANFKDDYYPGEHRAAMLKALAAAQKFTAGFAENPYEQGLLLAGEVGTGKTFLAACIANALLAEGVEVLFLVVPDLLDSLRATFDDHNRGNEMDILDVARDIQLLIMDDLGAHNYSDWVSGRLFSILNHRMNEQLPTIVTTNLTMAEIDTYIGARAASRLTQMCRFYRLTAPHDIRGVLYREREIGT
jgi:DNA replication protein DnaC